MMALLTVVVGTAIFLLAVGLITIIVCRRYFQRIRSQSVPRKNSADQTAAATTTTILAFFHPRCSGGGGGERVLWKAVQCLGQMRDDGIYPNLIVVIYTADEPRESYKEDLLVHVKTRFSIEIPKSLPLSFVHLDKEWNNSVPKRLTMIVESIQSMIVAWKALQKVTPHVYIDTTGCAFTLFIAKVLAGCKVGAYVHYPTISTDMLSLVWERRPTYNNNATIATNPIITYIKLIYYTLFAICYGAVGSLADLVMVNSSWTYDHIQFLWRGARQRIHIVYPPCDTKSLETLSLTQPPRQNNILLSIGQFRPEKDHALQLRSLAHMLKLHPQLRNTSNGDNNSSSSSSDSIKLILLGGCRNHEDQKRVYELQEMAKKLQIDDVVDFVLNQPYPILKEWLSRASAGLHTMWNEHFGIGVVEMMAAGVIVIAHNSGGPKMDIITTTTTKTKTTTDIDDDGNKKDVVDCTGYLASTEEEYADIMYSILRRRSNDIENVRIRECGRKAANRFSDEAFVSSFKQVIVSSGILMPCKK